MSKIQQLYRHSAWLWLLLLLPWLGLIPLGILWLAEQGQWWLWSVIAVLSVTVALWVQHYRQQCALTEQLPRTAALKHWTEAEQALFAQIQQQAAQLQAQDYPFDEQLSQRLLSLARQIGQQVAEHYYPNSRDPLWELSVPDMLRCMELVSRDLRQIAQQVPYVERVSLRQWRGLPDTLRWGEKALAAYRIGRLVLNPLEALVSELRAKIQGQVLDYSAVELKRWLLEEFVARVGLHAIQAYGGLQSRDEQAVATQRSALSEQEQLAAASASLEPLRFVLLGQTKAGKSSLINALFGQVQAAVDVLPLTQGFVAYQLPRLQGQELDAALILDSQGWEYGYAPNQAAFEQQLAHADCLILVCSALQAARAVDAQLLAELRRYYQAHPRQRYPNLVCVLTHIDQLRPAREWSPPYDLQQAASAKARTIRAAVESVAAELQLPVTSVVPVCLASERVYNVEEGLLPLLLGQLEQVQANRYRRCLQAQREVDWVQRWQQAKTSGRVLWQVSQQVLAQVPERWDEWWKRVD